MARLTPFLGGLSHARLDREGGIQWPCPSPDHPGTRFLYAESFPRGRGKFVPAPQTVEAAEVPDPEFPFVLNTGRLLYHWHGGTLTRRVQGLLELAPRLALAINPADARREALGQGRAPPAVARRGGVQGLAPVTEAGRPGGVLRPAISAGMMGESPPRTSRVGAWILGSRAQPSTGRLAPLALGSNR